MSAKTVCIPGRDLLPRLLSKNHMDINKATTPNRALVVVASSMVAWLKSCEDDIIGVMLMTV